MQEAQDQARPQALEGLFLPAEVRSVSEEYAVVQLKDSELLGWVPLSDFKVAKDDEPQVKVGDSFEVHVEQLAQDGSHYIVSRDKAVRLTAFNGVWAAFKAEEPVEGEVVGIVDGGFSVDIGVRAFLPASQIAMRQVRNPEEVLGQRFQFKIVRFERGRQNIVLSRRILMEAERDKRLEHLKEGAMTEGTVRSIADYGVFVDLGGADGLVHIKDLSWSPVSHPSEVVQVGDKIRVKVLKLDKNAKRISLGVRQLEDDPWASFEKDFPSGTQVSGPVVSKTDYGVFVEFKRGIEGLVHSTGPLVQPGDKERLRKVDIGDEVKAKIVDVDIESKRISMTLVVESN